PPASSPCAPLRQHPPRSGREPQARPRTSPMGIDPAPHWASRGLARQRLRPGAPHPPSATPRPGAELMPGVWERHAPKSGVRGSAPAASSPCANPHG
ncbi:MAG: hypothetical protein RMN24_09145, partial [Anaerolineae bacterium]|nr:hypothetical protein [Anaerolineae bacterium]